MALPPQFNAELLNISHLLTYVSTLICRRISKLPDTWTSPVQGVHALSSCCWSNTSLKKGWHHGFPDTVRTVSPFEKANIWSCPTTLCVSVVCGVFPFLFILSTLKEKKKKTCVFGAGGRREIVWQLYSHKWDAFAPDSLFIVGAAEVEECPVKLGWHFPLTEKPPLHDSCSSTGHHQHTFNSEICPASNRKHKDILCFSKKFYNCIDIQHFTFSWT